MHKVALRKISPNKKQPYPKRYGCNNTINIVRSTGSSNELTENEITNDRTSLIIRQNIGEYHLRDLLISAIGVEFRLF